MPLLEVQNLTVRFHTLDGIVHAVNGISYTLDQGETMGLVGESGCGKSVSVLAIMRLIPQPPGEIAAGRVIYDGRDLLRLSEAEMEQIRGKEIAMVFQDPMTAFNPVLTIGRQIAETLVTHLGMSWKEAHQRAAELLAMVGIPNAAERCRDYPHQFSGGMRQRAMIAMALACNPSILIADEPTTALDVTIQAQIIDLVKRLRDQLGMAVIWITHDLGIIAGLAEKVAVMYAGFIVEKGTVDDIYGDPRHPYTLALLRSLPRVDRSSRERLAVIPGLPPDLLRLPPGCPFAPRCVYRRERCLVENPTLRFVGDRHEVACWVDVRTGREA
ncbi:MAG: ABC transporter ATP-binding protein [Anaerolineae bacterium]|nr:ABC transporter ATP-binding protein [Anaerolineae bacterium]MCX8067219.1 ABC transporter ATP-binding protein [Anaerolineae bacterium]MDW7990821.1 ABC transporter ATP-binding protein [Anaerolineae bacterium]